MREELKSKIKKNLISLKKDMDAKELTDYFIQEEILEFSDVEEINGYNPNTAESRNNRFFQLIMKKEDRAYDVFLTALRANNQAFLADKIESTQVGANIVQQEDSLAWIDSLPSQVLGKVLEDRDLSRLAQSLGSDWEVVAYDLGLKKVDVDHCVMENQTVTMRVYSALYRWKNRVVSEATLWNFLRVLKDCQSTTIDWDTIKRYVNQISQG